MKKKGIMTDQGKKETNYARKGSQPRGMNKA